VTKDDENDPEVPLVGVPGDDDESEYDAGESNADQIQELAELDLSEGA
jgi:hypothetical protein